jgi:2-C-methyl-D-erythritol 4-phosphate cytidylyltransferase
MAWCVVPAAGAGRRFGGDRPKQYQLLSGVPMLLRTLERLASHPGIEGVVVALAPDDHWWSHATSCAGKPVLSCVGGDERAHSVLAALHALPPQVSARDWVLVHDAARPCVRHEDITHLLERGALNAHGALLGAPMRDTVKRADDSQLSAATVPRHDLWRAFTPQMFRRGELTAALERALAEPAAVVTDDASAMEAIGHRPLLVAGSEDNIKVTSATDLALAELILRRQEDE